MFKLRTIKDCVFKEGQKVLVRIDANEPVKDGVVANDFRLSKTLPLLEFLKEKRVKTILISHHSDNKQSLKPSFLWLKNKLPISFCDRDNFEYDEKILPKEGEFLMLENLRFDEREEKNNRYFSKILSKWGDVFINEAFSSSHREHSSIVGLPNFLPSFAGFLFEEEVVNLSKSFNPEKPFVLILGGAKSDIKISIVNNLLKKADSIFIGGAIANDFFKFKGFEIGNSLSSNNIPFQIGEILKSEKVFIPEKVLVRKKDGKILEKESNKIDFDDEIIDVSYDFISKIIESVKKSSFVLWNGPMGYTKNNFNENTDSLIQGLSKFGKETIVGGGDTVERIVALNAESDFSFVSTGGGAMLEFLAKETLPGIEVLKQG